MSWGEICRLCLKQGLKTFNIHSDSSQDSAVSMTIRIKWVTELDVTEGDGLPNQVCVPCLQKLNAGYEFKRQCLISDKTLRKFISQTNNNNNAGPDSPSASTPESSPIIPVKEEVITIEDDKKSPNKMASTDDTDDTSSLQNADLGDRVETVYRDDSDSALDLSISEGIISSEGSEPQTEAPMVTIPAVKKEPGAAKTKRKPRPLKCDYCPKTFYRVNTLDAHVKTHGTPAIKVEYKCVSCALTFNALSLYDRHLQTHLGRKSYTCDTCHQSFSTQGSLTVHKKSHTGQKDYKCHMCDKAFTVKGSLTTHLRTHTLEKPYTCMLCMKSFSVQRDLIRHSRCHTGEKNYKCDHCEKLFARRDSLTSHVRIHQGIKPYRCTVCPNSYPTQSNLSKHVKKQHSENSASTSSDSRDVSRQEQAWAVAAKTPTNKTYPMKPETRAAAASPRPVEKTSTTAKAPAAKTYSVKTETRAAARPVAQAVPEAANSLFECPSCSKTFTKQLALAKHFLVHKEDFPYKCTQCDRAFVQSINLTRHLKTHLDDGL